jgi:ABC-type transport system involved in multi-copper enzyme maturation permease subunit
MKRSWGPGPVFAFECVTAARRWRLYACRALFVFLLLVGLWTIWGPDGQIFRNGQEAAEVAPRFFIALVSIQLAVVVLAAPAVTAGAVCVDKSRGTLHHVFVTDLTGRELVLGKLASRLASLLALLACGLPVLALSGLLGGIDLLAALGAYCVTLGVAVLSCALALTFSVWARKPHQALLPTYAVLGLWCGWMPVQISLNWLGPPPTWLPEQWIIALSNPILCMFAPELDPSQNMLGAQVLFLGVTMLLSMGLVMVAAGNIRRVVLHQASRPARAEHPGFAGRLVARLPEPPLDGNPVLWREWHRKRPSRWAGRLWTTYAVVSFLASLFVIVTSYLSAYWGNAELAGLVNGWQVAIGLLLLSISAPLALAEERDRGSLDVIMATSLSTRRIVWGKWLGTFAVVPRLAILPIWIAIALALVTGHWGGVVLLIAMIFAPAAAITSLGLALATWIPRPGRAVAVSLLLYVLMTIGSSILMIVVGYPGGYGFGPFSTWPSFMFWETLVGLNPFHGVFKATRQVGTINGWSYFSYSKYLLIMPALLGIGAHLVITAVLLAATLLTFDRCLGRISERARPDRGRRQGVSPEGAVIGAVSGTLASLTLFWALGGTDVIASEPLAAVIATALGACFGGIAGGRVIGPTGWTMIAGALLGWVVTGTLLALLMPDISGVGGGALLGAPLGLIVGLRIGLRCEKARVARPT